MKIIAITTVFLTLFLTNSAISKENIEKISQKQEEKPVINSEKTIKFHKPETEAERALDEILRVESGMIKDSKLKRDDMFTKGFVEDCEKKKNDVLNSKECKEECGEGNPPCGLACYPFHENCIDHGSGDIIDQSDYTAPSCKTSYEDAKKVIILSNFGTEIGKQDTSKTSFIMKKQDNKWKIDGICCNVDYCIVNCKDR